MNEPTGREFDMLRAQVTANQVRLNDIDDHGTKGVAGLQVQMNELMKDLLEMKSEMNTRFGAHEKVHESDTQSRVTGRRWLIGTGIAAFLAMVAMVSLLVDITARLHH